MPPTSNLASLMFYIGRRYTFTEATYPGFSLLTPQQQRAFVVKHSSLHMSKSIGKIATEAERADHGGEMNQEDLKIATTKMLVNILKLAEVLGMTANELTEAIPQVMNSK